ncbi:MAG: hypothetical protein MUC68_05750 [Burkholderiaceae bacterium]|jgi:hypothetical protein|nr:hypothetical protein [Burkholderiaceae bacterium]
MRRVRPVVIALVGLSAATLVAPLSAATLDIDLLSVSQQRNKVQIPNSSLGSRFSLVDVLGKREQAGVRATLVAGGFRPGHQWRLVAAPFSIEDDGTLAAPVDFNGARFGAGPVRATYAFNSYRVTYRWPLAESANWAWHWGVTAKIRDAEIGLAQAAVSSTKTNTGFVPLLHLAGEGAWGKWRLSLDGDALASSQGRAIDLGARAGYALSPSLEVFGGVRVIEGGADNDTLYNFALLRQFSLGLRARF